MHNRVSAKQIIDRFPQLLRWHSGDPEQCAQCPSSPEVPHKGAIVFLNSLDLVQTVLQSEASIVVIPEKAATLASERRPTQTILTSPNVKLSMALVNSTFFSLSFMREPIGGQNIHPSVTIGKTAKIGKNVVVGPGAVISEGCVIGDNTTIGANTIIEPHSTLGNDCKIHPLVFIGHSCLIGNKVEIKSHSTIGSDGFGYAQDAEGNHYRIPHYGPVILEDDVHIGANVNIDRGTFEPTIIRQGTKMDNHIHVAHNNEIGKNCLITAGFISAGSTTIGDACVFGGRSSIGGHISIASNTTIGPVTVVSGSIREPGFYEGYPPIPSREFKKAQTSFRHLPRIRKNLTRVMRHLGLEDKESEKI